MADSSQKFIARNRAPRVQIEYDVELYGSEKKVQLPFVMGVMSDLSGKSLEELPALADRKFLDIDVDNFDQRMRAVAPRVEFSVPNTLTGDGYMAVDITFESMDDFSPAAIARKVEPLSKLLEARTQLSNLATYMDGKAGAEELIEKLLADPATLRALTSMAPGEGSDTDAALAGLRNAQDVEEESDDTGAILDSLKASAPEVNETPDNTDSILADVAAQKVVDEPDNDTTADALANLGKMAPKDEPVDDQTDTALAGLAASTVTKEENDTTDQVLTDLAKSEIVEGARKDNTAALDSLRDAAVETSESGIDADAALASLAQTGTDLADDVADAKDAALDALRSMDSPDAEPAAQDDTVLANLAASADNLPTDEPDRSATALDSLRDAAVDAETNDDQTQTALDALGASAAALETQADRSTDDALASLAAAEIESLPQTDTAGDALAGLAASAQDAPEEPDTVSAALDSLSELQPADDQEQETAALDDALGALASSAADDGPQADDVGAALAALSELPTQPEGSDGPDLDAALGALSASAPEPEGDDTSVSAALDALADQQTPETVETSADIDDALSGLAATAVEQDVEESGIDDALAALADLPTETAATPDDDIQRALEGVTELATDDEDANSGTEIEAALEALSEQPSDSEDNQDGTEDALASLEASAVSTEEPQDTSDDILADLATAAPAEELEDTTHADALADLLSQPEPDSTSDDASGQDDILEQLSNAEPAAATVPDHDEILRSLTSIDHDNVSTDDPLAGLDDILGTASEEPSPVDTETTSPPPIDQDPVAASIDEDDPLAGLDDLLGSQADVAPEPPAPDPTVVATQEDADDPLAGLDDLLASQPDDAGGQTDVTSNSLDELIGADDSVDQQQAAPTPADDPLAGLDELLGGGMEPGPDGQSPDPQPEAAPDNPLAGLDDLLGETPDPTPVDEDPLAGLEDLLSGGETREEAQPEGASGTSDPLAELELSFASDSSENDDPLAGLDDILDDPAPKDAAAPSPETAKLADVQIPFGTITADRPDMTAIQRPKFRIALLGDFSGRAAKGQLEIGPQLAARKPIPFDVDDVEELIESFATKLVLPLGKDGRGIEVSLNELDDLHPDELYENVDIFSEISGLRQRLQAGSMADAAVGKLKEWGAQYGAEDLPLRMPPASSSVPANRKLTDFQSLIGDVEGRLASPTPGADFIAQIVGPYVQDAPDPGVAGMLDVVDKALSSAMRLVLHAPEFQAIEAQWRSLDFLARRVETSTTLELVLYDVSAEEIAADLAAQEDLSAAGLTQLLAELPMAEDGPGAFSAVMGMYTFEETPPHAELLARISRLAAHIDAAFFTAISPEFMKIPKGDRHPLVARAWDDLRAMPEARYLGLVSPRFLLRRPYGKKTDPVSAFEFEEFTMKEGLKGMLWANPVVAVTVLLAASFQKNGKSMGLGDIMSLGDIPFHYVTDAHGDQVALPCTERNITTTVMEDIVTRGFMPVVSPKGRDEIRLASFQSVGGGEIMGPWSGEERPQPTKMAPPPAAPPVDQAGDTENLEDDLDALLADLGGGGDSEESGDLDSELAALLEGL